MKEYRKKIWITSLVAILPMVVGIILWNRLPDRIATHFGTDGTPNGWSSKMFAVVGLPVFLTVIHLFTVAVTLNDPKKKNIGTKMLSFVLWTVPVVSWICSIMNYAYAMNIKVDMTIVMHVMLGVLFLLCGNYMAKSHQNYTVGIKLPWTLNSEENWNLTHRLASRIWCVLGLVSTLNIFFNSMILFWIAFAAAVIVPTVYSFMLYKKGI